MKYSLPQTPTLFARTIIYTLHAQKLSYLIVIAGIISLAEVTTSPVPALIYFGLLLFCLLILVANYWASSKLYRDKDGNVSLTYNLQKDAITISVQSKMNIPFEKEGLKKVKVFKHGVYIKHQRTSFIVYFPAGKRADVLAALNKYGWTVQLKSTHNS